MTPAQKALVRASFDKVQPIASAAAALFYGKLFELDPALKPLFKGDMNEQGRKLMAMIGTAVSNLDKLDVLIPAVQALGRRHNRYGVIDSHYTTVAAALLWTLERGLGDDFTPATREAWTVVYTVLADTMKAAQKEAP
ncbi:globin family protein [Roseiterribacter gracilis]|uniref:Hemoglobin n=1 Tax=Roseiterribacter gracilis TaxID=2812848 RepID=A0A8S8X9L3_9PROT|nr:hemoglobin [Rhodospirillales bacterium TMPK1]